MKSTDLQRLRAEIAELKERCEHDVQGNAIFEANLVLAIDETKASLLRLGRLEKESRDRAHSYNNAQTSLNLLLDHLDRLLATTPKTGHT